MKKENLSEEKIGLKKKNIIKKKIKKRKQSINNKKNKKLSLESLSLKNIGDLDSFSINSYSKSNDYLYLLNHDDSYNSLLLKQDFEDYFDI